MKISAEYVLIHLSSQNSPISYDTAKDQKIYSILMPAEGDFIIFH